MIEVKRIETETGSHIEPGLDQRWTEFEKLEWRSAVTMLDTGLNVRVTVAQRGGYIVWQGATGHTFDYQDAWSRIIDLGDGAELYRQQNPEIVWDAEQIGRVKQWARMAGDSAHWRLVDSGKPFTGADDGGAIAAEVVDFLLGVGLVLPKAEAEWPENIALNPPYVPDPWAAFRKVDES